MRLEEGKRGRQQPSFAGTGAKLAGIEPGEVKEPLGATFVGECRRERCQCQRLSVRRVVYRLSAEKE